MIMDIHESENYKKIHEEYEKNKDKPKKIATLPEAIEYCEKVADEAGEDSATEENHRRLARWLRVLGRDSEVLDGLKEAYFELSEQEFMEFCKDLWGEPDEE